jgi:dTMP kinase
LTRTRGRFVVLDGPDGAGKSTQAQLLVNALGRRGVGTLHLRDPGSTALAEGVRRLLLDPGTGELTASTEVLLFCACRAELVAREILPALEHGVTVVCERFVSSTLVYQGVGRGVREDWIRAVHAESVGGLRPDRVVLLDVDPETAWQRRQARRARDRFEERGQAFHAAVVQGFRALAVAEPAIHRLVDARGPTAEVAARVLAAVVDLFPA